MLFQLGALISRAASPNVCQHFRNPAPKQTRVLGPQAACNNASTFLSSLNLGPCKKLALPVFGENSSQPDQAGKHFSERRQDVVIDRRAVNNLRVCLSRGRGKILDRRGQHIEHAYGTPATPECSTKPL